MNQIFFATLIFAAFSSHSFAQDFHFVQSIRHPQIINPAVTGSQSILRSSFTAFYRGQWDKVTSNKSYQGAAVAADVRFCLPLLHRNYFALGVVLQNDWNPWGGLSNSMARLSGAFHLQLDRETFAAAGAYFGGLNYRLDPDRLRFDAQYQNGNYNPGAPNGETFPRNSATKQDLGTGFTIYNHINGWSAGMALHHLNKPSYSLFDDTQNELSLGWVFHGAVAIMDPSTDKPKYLFRAVYRHQSFAGLDNRQQQVLFGLLKRIPFPGDSDSFFNLGVYGRVGADSNSSLKLNSLIPALEMGGDRYSFSLSFDANLVRTRSRFTGGLELSLNFNFNGKDNCVICPRP